MSHSRSVRWSFANFFFKMVRTTTNSTDPALATYQYVQIKQLSKHSSAQGQDLQAFPQRRRFPRGANEEGQSPRGYFNLR
jgi:hypothetical protein